MKKAFIIAITVFTFGCNYEFKETPQANNVNSAEVANQRGTDPVSANSSDANNANKSKTEEQGGELVLNATAEDRTIECSGREVVIEDDATANTYKFTGECKKLTVKGVSNKVSVEKVGEINASGISNKVVYGEGIGGKAPKIIKTGKSTTVDSQKEAERKSEANK
ncbi:MAG: DUF3060 domain-containing protein [Pyrinomonadaceae bacterium]|nr:DUF3060 domain-containing protein [Pyrinomonadaceae bacterium]